MVDNGGMSDAEITVRPATPDDVVLIWELIRGLAEYERLLDECHATPEALAEHLFGAHPVAEVLIAEDGDGPAGFALFFPTYSTFVARPGIWLEDLFVRPERRGTGCGRALLERVAQLAVQRGCGRLEWAVLDWNGPAIGFYERLGARPLDEWRICRLDGAALARMASGPPEDGPL